MIEYSVLVAKALVALRSLSKVVSGMTSDIEQARVNMGNIADYNEKRRQIKYMGEISIRYKRLTAYKADLPFMLEIYGNGRKNNDGNWGDVQYMLVALLDELDGIQSILIEKNFGKLSLERKMIIKISESKRYISRIMDEPKTDKDFQAYLKIGQTVQIMQEDGEKAFEEANAALIQSGGGEIKPSTKTIAKKHKVPRRIDKR